MWIIIVILLIICFNFKTSNTELKRKLEHSDVRKKESIRQKRNEVSKSQIHINDDKYTRTIYEKNIEGEIKIGKIVQNIMRKILMEDIITEYEIDFMKKADYSKNIFNLNFPLLREIDEDIDIDKQKEDTRGYKRYYKSPIYIKGKMYLLTSQWYENQNREYLENWLNNKFIELIEERKSKIGTYKQYSNKSVLKDYWFFMPENLRGKLSEV